MLNLTLISLPETRWKKFAFNLVVWAVIGTLFTLQSYLYRKHVGQIVTWWGLYPTELFFFVSCGLCAPFVMIAARRFPVDRKNWISRILIHLGFAISGAIAHRFVYEMITQNIKATIERPFSWDAVSRNVIGFSDYGFLIYFIIVFVSHALEYNKRFVSEQLASAHLKEQLVTAQLSALRMQLQPHFLFNTLNTISVLIRDDPAKAEQMVGVLSDLLRFTLQQSKNQELPLREELEFLRMYLHIEQARFGERLAVTYDIAPDTTDAQIPTFILQPLVENAVRHGIAERRGQGQIIISSKRINGSLQVAIKDNGKGILHEHTTATQEGIGLQNCEARLQTLYGNRAAIHLSNLENGGAMVEITLPFHINTK